MRRPHAKRLRDWQLAVGGQLNAIPNLTTVVSCRHLLYGLDGDLWHGGWADNGASIMRIILIFVLASALGLLGGCGNGSRTATTEPPPAANTTLNWDEGNWDQREWQ